MFAIWLNPIFNKTNIIIYQWDDIAKKNIYIL